MAGSGDVRTLSAHWPYRMTQEETADDYAEAMELEGTLALEARVDLALRRALALHCPAAYVALNTTREAREEVERTLAALGLRRAPAKRRVRDGALKWRALTRQLYDPPTPLVFEFRARRPDEPAREYASAARAAFRQFLRLAEADENEKHKAYKSRLSVNRSEMAKHAEAWVRVKLLAHDPSRIAEEWTVADIESGARPASDWYDPSAVEKAVARFSEYAELDEPDKDWQKTLEVLS